jgi:hypothetical protein
MLGYIYQLTVTDVAGEKFIFSFVRENKPTKEELYSFLRTKSLIPEWCVLSPIEVFNIEYL